MNQLALIHSILMFLDKCNIRAFRKDECGCWKVKFVKTWKHYCSEAHEEADRLKKPNAIPRWCPCGLCHELRKKTARAFRNRDFEEADRLRGERIEHYPTCVVQKVDT